MIYGTGMDMIEISRIEKLLTNHENLSRIYGPEELAMLMLKRLPQSYAANFSAKEAFAKALGTGIRGFHLNEVQLMRNPVGKPFFQFSGAAGRIVKNAGLMFHVTVTHTQNYAAAFVVAERKS